MYHALAIVVILRNMCIKCGQLCGPGGLSYMKV